MQGCITNAARGAIASAAHVWMIRMRKEWHTVSKSGVEFGWTGRFTQVKVQAHIKVSYVRDARMVIVVNCDQDGLTGEEARKETVMCNKGLGVYSFTVPTRSLADTHPLV